MKKTRTKVITGFVSALVLCTMAVAPVMADYRTDGWPVETRVSGTVNGSVFTDSVAWTWSTTEEYTVAVALPTADCLGIEDASGSSGSYVEVPVNITNVRNGPIQGIRLGVDYDKNILNMTSIRSGDLTSKWTTMRLGEDRRTMLIVTGSDDAIQNGSSGTIVLLNFSVTGSLGDTSPMNMSLIELAPRDGTVVGRTVPARNGSFTVTSTGIFDTGEQENPYPSISGMHNGSIIFDQAMVINKLFTYSCPGTGGHSEYVAFYNTTTGEEIANGTWNGYSKDWHNITFKNHFELQAGTIYNYTLKTGSYPQIIHATEFNATGGKITCTEFVDSNGRLYNDWIPAIMLWGDR